MKEKNPLLVIKVAAWTPSKVPYSPPKFYVLSLKKILSAHSPLKNSDFVWISQKIPLPKEINSFVCSLCPKNCLLSKKSCACLLYPYLYGNTFLLWDILFPFFNAHGYGKRINGGSLGDSLKDVVVSYLVSDQILTMLTFLSKKTKKNLFTAHYMCVVHKVATSFQWVAW